MRRFFVFALAVLLALSGLVFWQMTRPQPQAEPTGMLALYDLDAAQYALVFRLGADMPNGPGNAEQAWLIDDQDWIRAHRNEIDISLSFLDFVPGEGRGGLYLYLFENGRKVAGRIVSMRDQIKLPADAVEQARVVHRSIFSGNRAGILAELERLEARSALVDAGNAPGPATAEGEFFFFGRLPTLALPEDEAFDAEAYTQILEEKIRTMVVGDYRLTVSVANQYPPGSIYFVEADGWTLQKGADGQVATLDNVTLYNFSVQVEGDPSLYPAFTALDLDALVKNRRNNDLLVAAWHAATGAEKAPEQLRLSDYETGYWSQVIERTYGLTYWQ